MNTFITKASGKKERFNELKIRSSFLRSGATKQIADDTVRAVKKNMPSGIMSSEIYARAQKHLKKENPAIAARYSLKKAIMMLGPAGYFFERYFSRILDEYGYKTKVGQIVEGYCVKHEVDVIARKDKRHFMIECKYHNKSGTRSDVKVALYVHSRFLDVAKAWEMKPGHGQMFHEGWLVTNTRCTTDAVKYASCVGLRIIAWRYPVKKGLEYYIENKKLYPITILASLTKQDKERLVEAKLILAKDLLKYSTADLVNTIGLKRNNANILRQEAVKLREC